MPYAIVIDIDTIYSYHDECIKSEMFSRSMGGGGGTLQKIIEKHCDTATLCELKYRRKPIRLLAIQKSLRYELKNNTAKMKQKMIRGNMRIPAVAAPRVTGGGMFPNFSQRSIF